MLAAKVARVRPRRLDEQRMLLRRERVGHVTSASVAPTLDAFAGLAWIHGPLDGAICLEIGGEPVPVKVSVDPFYDPKGERLRS